MNENRYAPQQQLYVYFALAVVIFLVALVSVPNSLGISNNSEAPQQPKWEPPSAPQNATVTPSPDPTATVTNTPVPSPTAILVVVPDPTRVPVDLSGVVVKDDAEDPVLVSFMWGLIRYQNDSRYFARKMYLEDDFFLEHFADTYYPPYIAVDGDWAIQPKNGADRFYLQFKEVATSEYACYWIAKYGIPIQQTADENPAYVADLFDYALGNPNGSYYCNLVDSDLEENFEWWKVFDSAWELEYGNE